jgi:coenzyme F420-reducing hydrogenase delta subunit
MNQGAVMGDPLHSGDTFEPAIAGFFCRLCGDDSLSKSGKSHGDFFAGLKSVRIICAEKVGPDLIRQTFENGADGILICGCLVGRCKSLDGDAEVLAHIHQAKMVLKEMDIAPGRLRQEWICAPGGDSIGAVVEKFTEKIGALGPLEVPVLGSLQANQ